MSLFKKQKEEEVITVREEQGSILCEGLTFKGGSLEGVGKVTINCYFIGNIITNDLVVIGEAGNILGDIESQSIIIQGNVNGNIEVVDSAQIRTGGILNGNIKCGDLKIDSGAAFSGECNMTTSRRENNILNTMKNSNNPNEIKSEKLAELKESSQAQLSKKDR